MGIPPKAVAADLIQPQGSHDLLIMELPWFWVEHGSSSPSWAD